MMTLPRRFGSLFAAVHVRDTRLIDFNLASEALYVRRSAR